MSRFRTILSDDNKQLTQLSPCNTEIVGVFSAQNSEFLELIFSQPTSNVAWIQAALPLQCSRNSTTFPYFTTHTPLRGHHLDALCASLLTPAQCIPTQQPEGPFLNTIMHHLMTGIHSTTYVFRQSCHCANLIMFI